MDANVLLLMEIVGEGGGSLLLITCSMQNGASSVFACCKRSETGAGEGLGTRLTAVSRNAHAKATPHTNPNLFRLTPERERPQ